MSRFVFVILVVCAVVNVLNFAFLPEHDVDKLVIAGFAALLALHEWRDR